MTSAGHGLQPDLIKGELLSSYLVRFAACIGVTPHRLQGQFGKKFEIWTRDVDRTISDGLVAAVARRCNVENNAIEAMTLRDYEQVLCQSNSAQRRQGTASWINAVGVFHRKRTLHGLQYCPKCLEECSAYKRIWRLSFVTTCEKHSIMLRDSCPHCDEAVIPHRSRQAGVRCHKCGRLLFGESVRDQPVIQGCVNLQKFFLDAIEIGFIQLGARTLTAPDFFLGASQLLQVVKEKLVRGRELGVVTGAQFELSRANERAHCVAELCQFLDDWPNRFIGFAATHKICQVRFAGYRRVPAWLREIINELPKRNRAYRRAKVSSKYAQENGNSKIVNWRTLRARTLLRAAGVRK